MKKKRKSAKKRRISTAQKKRSQKKKSIAPKTSTKKAGIEKKDIILIRLGKIFHQDELKYKKTWIVHPVLVKVKTDKIKLDWESRSHKWIKIKEAKNFNLLPGFDKVLKNLFNYAIQRAEK